MMELSLSRQRAKACASAMARVLLMGLFSVDVLLKSNVKGGVSKLNPSAERRQALDPKKLQALQSKLFSGLVLKLHLCRGGWLHGVGERKGEKDKVSLIRIFWANPQKQYLPSSVKSINSSVVFCNVCILN